MDVNIRGFAIKIEDNATTPEIHYHSLGVWYKGRITRRKTGANKRKPGSRPAGPVDDPYGGAGVGPCGGLCDHLSASFAAYYYSNMQSDMQHRAKTTTEFFCQLHRPELQRLLSVLRYLRQDLEEKNTIELQFINTSGRIVASSYGRWVGPSPTTQEISSAMETRQLATYMGKDPATGERIMAVSSPMIYSSGEVIGVLRYVTSMKVVNRQLVFCDPGCPGGGSAAGAGGDFQQ